MEEAVKKLICGKLGRVGRRVKNTVMGNSDIAMEEIPLLLLQKIEEIVGEKSKGQDKPQKGESQRQEQVKNGKKKERGAGQTRKRTPLVWAF